MSKIAQMSNKRKKMENMAFKKLKYWLLKWNYIMTDSNPVVQLINPLYCLNIPYQTTVVDNEENKCLWKNHPNYLL